MDNPIGLTSGAGLSFLSRFVECNRWTLPVWSAQGVNFGDLPKGKKGEKVMQRFYTLDILT